MWDDQARRSIACLEKDSEAGDSNSSYWAHRVFEDGRRSFEAVLFLERAKAQGHPIAKQKWARLAMIGRFGMSRVPEGIALYVSNIPALIRYIKQNS